MSNKDDQVAGLFSQIAAKAARSVKGFLKVETIVTCADCGEYIRQGDTSPCGAHPELDIAEDSFLVRIGIVKPLPKLEPPAPVIEASPKKAVKQIEPKEPAIEVPTERRVPSDGAYSRALSAGAQHDSFRAKVYDAFVGYEPERDSYADEPARFNDGETYGTREG